MYKKILLIVMALSTCACAAIRQENSQVQNTGLTAFSNSVRIGYFDATNTTFNTNAFPTAFGVTTKDGIIIPAGTSNERPVGAISGVPILRFNSQSLKFEYKFSTNGTWAGITDLEETARLAHQNNTTNFHGLYATNIASKAALGIVGNSLLDTKGDILSIVGDITKSYVVVDSTIILPYYDTPNSHPRYRLQTTPDMGWQVRYNTDHWSYTDPNTEYNTQTTNTYLPPYSGYLGGHTVELHTGTLAVEEALRVYYNTQINTTISNHINNATNVHGMVVSNIALRTELSVVSNKAHSAYEVATNAYAIATNGYAIATNTNAKLIIETNRAIQTEQGIGTSLTNTQGDVSSLIGNISNSYVVVNGIKYTYIGMAVGRPQYQSILTSENSVEWYPTSGRWVIFEDSIYTNSSAAYLPPYSGWNDSTGGVANITVEFHPGTLAEEESARISNDFQIQSNLTGLGVSLTNTQGDVTALIGFSNSYVVVNGNTLPYVSDSDGRTWSTGAYSLYVLNGNTWVYDGPGTASFTNSSFLSSSLPPSGIYRRISGTHDSTNLVIEFHSGNEALEESARIAAITGNSYMSINGTNILYNSIWLGKPEYANTSQAPTGTYHFVLWQTNHWEYITGHSPLIVYTNLAQTLYPPSTGWLNQTGEITDILLKIFNAPSLADETALRITTDATITSNLVVVSNQITSVKSNMTELGTSLTNTQGDVISLIGNVAKSYVIVTGTTHIDGIYTNVPAFSNAWRNSSITNGLFSYSQVAPYGTGKWLLGGNPAIGGAEGHTNITSSLSFPPRTGWLNSTGGVSNISVEFHPGSEVTPFIPTNRTSTIIGGLYTIDTNEQVYIRRN